MRNSSTKSNAIYVICFVEFWERFCYFGIRALLILFLTTGLDFTDQKSFTMYSLFAAIGYAVPVIAGIIADRFWGNQKSIIFGNSMMCIGSILLTFYSLDDNLLYVGLSSIAIGTGFFKGNAATLFGLLFEDDHKRDKGFTFFYIIINVAAFTAAVCCGYICHIWGWQYGFGIASLSMLLSLMIFLKFRYLLNDIGSTPYSNKYSSKITDYIVTFCCALMLVVSIAMLNDSEYYVKVFAFSGVLVLALLIKTVYNLNNDEKYNVYALIILAFFFSLFFSLEMQLGSLINLFIERNVDTTIFGLDIPASIFQSVNPMVILILGPLIAIFFSKMNYKYYMHRFMFGLAANVICFFILYLSSFDQTSIGKINIIYLVIAVSFMSVGELCIAPLVSSLFVKLSPVKIKGFMMGVLMFSVAYSNLMGTIVGKFVSIPQEVIANSVESLKIYQAGFLKITIFNFIVLCLFVLSMPYLNKIMFKYHK